VATEVESGRQLFTLPVGVEGDVLLAPDGRTLYLSDGNALLAVDAVSGVEHWREPLDDTAHATSSALLASVASPDSGGERPAHIGHGRSPFAVSSNGTRLYIQVGGPIQVRDAATGALLSQTETVRSACAGRFHPSPDGRYLYIICQSLDVYLVIALESGAIERTELDQLGGIVAGSAQSRDGRWLYVVSATGTLSVLDLTTGALATQPDVIDDARVTDLMVGLADGDEQLYVGVSTSGSRFATDQVRAFSVADWREAGRTVLSAPLTGTALTGAPDGGSYVVAAEIIAETLTGSLVELATNGAEQTLIVRPGEAIITLAQGEVGAP
jgi:outer membrane protein assembly factor BamB